MFVVKGKTLFQWETFLLCRGRSQRCWKMMGKEKSLKKKSQELIFSPGSCSKLANKSKGDLEPAQLLFPTQEAGGNARHSSQHLRPKSHFCWSQINTIQCTSLQQASETIQDTFVSSDMVRHDWYAIDFLRFSLGPTPVSQYSLQITRT